MIDAWAGHPRGRARGRRAWPQHSTNARVKQHNVRTGAVAVVDIQCVRACDSDTHAESGARTRTRRLAPRCRANRSQRRIERASGRQQLLRGAIPGDSVERIGLPSSVHVDASERRYMYSFHLARPWSRRLVAHVLCSCRRRMAAPERHRAHQRQVCRGRRRNVYC